jgi:GGDEF domain-containing protein
MMVSSTVPPVVLAPNSVLTVNTIPEPAASVIARWSERAALPVSSITADAFAREALHGAPPMLIALSGIVDDNAVRAILRTVKRDARLQTIPAIVVAAGGSVSAWLAHGADDVLHAGQHACEMDARLTAALRRSQRDIQVNPSTRLVGADAITTAIAERLHVPEPFAACYADLDHFKEFNDRYGYVMGDDVIRTVAALLVEVVEATAGVDGFVGHIGGDDFLFLVPLSCVAETCDTLVRRADEILSMRYSAHDRQAGYFFGKDRRGRLDRVPLMTLSIGVVTNERRHFAHAAQVSELATEMKTYAKTLPGSVWAMDRRSDGESVNPPEEKHQ